MIRGTCEFKQLERFAEKMQKLEVTSDEFIEAVCKEIAARLLRIVIMRTPVDTGMLRSGWTSTSEEQAARLGGVDVTTYVNSLKVHITGNEYRIEIINPVQYASYVEYGHMNKGGRSFQLGRKMMTIAVGVVETRVPSIIEKHLQKQMRQILK